MGGQVAGFVNDVPLHAFAANRVDYSSQEHLGRLDRLVPCSHDKALLYPLK